MITNKYFKISKRLISPTGGLFQLNMIQPYLRNTLIHKRINYFSNEKYNHENEDNDHKFKDDHLDDNLQDQYINHSINNKAENKLGSPNNNIVDNNVRRISTITKTSFEKKIDEVNGDDDANNSYFSNENRVFVSKHFILNPDEIFKLLEISKIDFKVSGNGVIRIKYCPFCPKPHHNKIDNLNTLAISANTGSFLCFRCGTKGSWFDFKNFIHGNNFDFKIESLGDPDYNHSTHSNTSSLSGAFPKKIASESVHFLRHKALINNEFPEIVEYLTGKGSDQRHLTIDTLTKYKVGIGYEPFIDENNMTIDKLSVFFPMFAPKSDKSIVIPKKSKSKEKNSDPEKNQVLNAISDENYILTRTKVRAIYKNNKGYQRLQPAPGYWGLFGFNIVPSKCRQIVITEGEFDAMAVYQATSIPAVSLPNGANNLPLQVLPWLEKFERIYLWMDADAVGKTNAVNFAHKLGVNRVFIVNTQRDNPNGPKDANDALREDPKSLKRYLMEARPLTQENVTTFSEMKSIILNRILKYHENIGVQSEYFKWFNKKIKGFRRGEFTVITGGTGSGKTSLLSQMSIDFANQGVSTLWGSFEVKNDILMTSMILQYSGVNLFNDNHKFDYYSEKFEKLPIYFLKFFGSTQIDKIINTIEYSIYAYDIGHVIIDNLQFLLSGQGRGFERFEIQDDAIARLRALATDKNVHITLVIHPKKVDDNQDLTISSVFGSAKATQEADNIFIIQNRPKYRVIEVKKNRFDGELGRVALGFDKSNKRFYELTEDEVFELNRTPITIKEIIEKRQKSLEITGDNEKESLKTLKGKVDIKNEDKFKAQYEQFLKELEAPIKKDGEKQDTLFKKNNKEEIMLGDDVDDIDAIPEEVIQKEGGELLNNPNEEVKKMDNQINVEHMIDENASILNDKRAKIDDDAKILDKIDELKDEIKENDSKITDNNGIAQEENKLSKAHEMKDIPKMNKSEKKFSTMKILSDNKNNDIEVELNEIHKENTLSEDNNNEKKNTSIDNTTSSNDELLYTVKIPSWSLKKQIKTSFYNEQEKDFVSNNIRDYADNNNKYKSKDYKNNYDQKTNNRDPLDFKSSNNSNNNVNNTKSGKSNNYKKTKRMILEDTINTDSKDE